MAPSHCKFWNIFIEKQWDQVEYILQDEDFSSVFPVEVLSVPESSLVLDSMDQGKENQDQKNTDQIEYGLFSLHKKCLSQNKENENQNEGSDEKKISCSL